MKKIRVLKILIMATMLIWAWKAAAGTVVVVNSSNTSDISKVDVANIYLGKTKVFKNGSEVIPLDQPEGEPIRDIFIKEVVNKNANQYKAYWSQLLFSGRGSPPRVVSDAEEIKKLIAANPALIGYIDSDQVDSSVRVVLEF